MMTYQQALAILSSERLATSGSPEYVPLAQARGRILSQDLSAKIDSPPFTNSAMDGFAVKIADATRGALRIKGAVYARPTAPHEIPLYQAMSCVRIMTGAVVPEWADTVIQVENAKVVGDSVTFTEFPAEGANIRRRGDDLKNGSLLLKTGTRMDAERMMVAAAFGHSSVEVQRDLGVALFSTGDELTEPGEILAPGAIYNSSKYFLAAAAASEGLRITEQATLLDDEALAAKKIAEVLATDRPTLILTTGAVSAGELDFIPKVAAHLGFEAKIHRVAIRPGKPVFFATKGSVSWLGLPGNPVSTCVGWHYFARPLIAALTNRPAPVKVKLKLANEVKKNEGLRCFFRAEVNNGRAWVARKQGSAELAASAGLNAYVELPEGRGSFPVDSEVEAILV